MSPQLLDRPTSKFKFHIYCLKNWLPDPESLAKALQHINQYTMFCPARLDRHLSFALGTVIFCPVWTPVFYCITVISLQKLHQPGHSRASRNWRVEEIGKQMVVRSRAVRTRHFGRKMNVHFQLNHIVTLRTGKVPA